MIAKIKYKDEPIGEPKIIQDFLSSPDDLTFREEDVKITITLRKKVLSFSRQWQRIGIRSIKE